MCQGCLLHNCGGHHSSSIPEGNSYPTSASKTQSLLEGHVWPRPPLWPTWGTSKPFGLHGRMGYGFEEPEFKSQHLFWSALWRNLFLPGVCYQLTIPLDFILFNQKKNILLFTFFDLYHSMIRVRVQLTQLCISKSLDICSFFHHLTTYLVEALQILVISLSIIIWNSEQTLDQIS